MHLRILGVGGGGALTPCLSWEWRGLKKIHHPLRIISGTALSESVQGYVLCLLVSNAPVKYYLKV